ncbi:PhaM family polyhydroxyalkanoate granule multifunctional regulatory protein [Undibacterium sp. Tian12W]|uniref:PhaM family polyhydroxyalkanoate granule multifunctional regulatory protein n=1 Tax=Undibacterium sp. Tian12W TaxID=3413054 RepID=UPI003BF45591
MSNPFSGSEIPGMNAMGDTLSFVKKLWGNMQVPGMVAPPMSVDELDKKIQDLKTVESWLTVNMNMLRGTIQALEVQRATLAALQSLGESFAQHAQQAGAMAEQAVSATAAATTGTTGVGNPGSNADWPMHPNAAKTKVAEPDPDEEVEEDSADMPPEAGANSVEADVPADENAQSAGSAKAAKAAETTDTSTPFVNPAAWWGLLQEQFKQAVSKAMEGQQAEVAGATVEVPEKKTAAKKTGSKPAAKPASRPAAAKPASKTKTAATGKTLIKAVSKAATKPTAKPAVRASKTSKDK